MKQLKFYAVIILLLTVLIIPSVALASWWNPFTWNWNIWQNIWNSIFYKPQVSVECTKAKDCQDIHKNCYYTCSSNKCAQINTFVALKPYPDCSSAVSCVPNWQCGWGPCIIPPCAPPGNSAACTNGSQSQIAVDSNNCGLPPSSAKIACPALARICTSPQPVSCSGPNDASCPIGYKCIQSCGPPVARVGDLPPPYFCELNEIANKPRSCPICLASNTNIYTPNGNVNVKDIKTGMHVWSLNNKGEKIESTIIKVSSVDVPKTHKVIHLILSDGRAVWASANHPTINGLYLGELKIGDLYDGSKIKSADAVPYWDNKTYDILPDSGTGYYWANGILLGSTLAVQ
jgi:hypothetical protein